MRKDASQVDYLRRNLWTGVPMEDTWNSTCRGALGRVEAIMRTFIGMVLGCFLTIAGAYVHDLTVTSTAANGMPASTSNTLVNWDVAAHKWSYIKNTVRTAWVKLQSIGDQPGKNGA
jgi:hypothetical protein